MSGIKHLLETLIDQGIYPTTGSTDTITTYFLRNSLLNYSYLPIQKETREELPPIFKVSNLNSEKCNPIYSFSERPNGYDYTTYKLTRHNNVTRNLQIPHPIAYLKLVQCIEKNWDKLSHICDSPHSLVKPMTHADGRLIIMDYNMKNEKVSLIENNAIGYRFIVNTDITNFFPSIYSHSICWALIGFKEAKQNKDKKKWPNTLDHCISACNRDETNGTLIGPSTSNIISEILLQKIDKKLSDKFTFYRFIDDYTAFCNTHTEAENFIKSLSIELEKYRLKININKTKITEAPAPKNDEWINDISIKIGAFEKISESIALKILDYAIQLNSNEPDGSILKYTIKSIDSKIETYSRVFIAKVLELSFHFPILLPLFESLIKDNSFNFTFEFTSILKNNIKLKRSDGIVWCLYYILKKDKEIPPDIYNDVIDTKDCLSILTLLFFTKNDTKPLIAFISKFTDNATLYDLDQYWILLYHAYKMGKIKNPYSKEGLYKEFSKKKRQTLFNEEVKLFQILKRADVSFINIDFFNPKDSISDMFTHIANTQKLTKLEDNS